MKILINEVWNKNENLIITDPDKEIKLNNLLDQIFDNNINYLIKETKKSYEEMKYKNVLKYGFYEMINIKDQYILYNEDNYNKLNPILMIKYLITFFIINNPIIPHFTEYMYITYLNPIFEKYNMKEKKIEFLCNAKYPKVLLNIDMKLIDINKYLNKVIQTIREVVNKKDTKKNRKESNENNKNIKIKVLYSKEYNNNQKEVLNILRNESYDENNKIILNDKNNIKYKNKILLNENLDKNTKKKMLEFASFKIKEVELYGLEVLNEKLKFNEEEILNINKELFKKLAKLDDIEFDVYDESKKPNGYKDEAIPGKPLVIKL